MYPVPRALEVALESKPVLGPTRAGSQTRLHQTGFEHVCCHNKNNSLIAGEGWTAVLFPPARRA